MQVANLSSIWTVCYTQPSRYNWMLQYYLRAEGLALSWIGTGRLIFSLNYTDADFDAVADRFVAAAKAMQRGRLVVVAMPATTNKSIKRRILREIIAHRFAPRTRPAELRNPERMRLAGVWIRNSSRTGRRARHGVSISARRAADRAAPCGRA